MILKRIIAGFTFLLVLTSCGKEPVANFTWEPKEPKAGQEVQFTNLSIDAKSYSWNFGDMSIGNETNPTHIYENKGSYIIDLSAHNGLKSDEKTATITVTD